MAGRVDAETVEVASRLVLAILLAADSEGLERSVVELGAANIVDCVVDAHPVTDPVSVTGPDEDVDSKVDDLLELGEEGMRPTKVTQVSITESGRRLRKDLRLTIATVDGGATALVAVRGGANLLLLDGGAGQSRLVGARFVAVVVGADVVDVKLLNLLQRALNVAGARVAGVAVGLRGVRAGHAVAV